MAAPATAIPAKDEQKLQSLKGALQRWQGFADIQARLFGQMAEDAGALSERIGDDMGGLDDDIASLLRLSREQEERIAAAIASAGQIRLGEEVLSLQDFGQFIESTLNNVIGLTVHYSKQAMEMVYRLGHVVHSLDTIEKLVDGVGEVNRKTTMLALNATIEAERAGEAGKTFQVVAREVRDLATRVDSLAGDIRYEMGIINSGIRETHHMLVEFAGTDMSPSIQAEDRLLRLLRSLLQQQQSLSSLTNDAREATRQSEGLNPLPAMAAMRRRIQASFRHLGDTLALFERQTRGLSRATRDQAYANSEDRRLIAESLRSSLASLPLDDERRENIQRLLNDYKTSAWHDLVNQNSPPPASPGEPRTA